MRRFWLVLAALVWAGGSLLGFTVIYRYASGAQAATQAPAQWPDKGGLKKTPDGFDLVMAVHPRCPCTRASVAELNKLLQAQGGRLRAHALVFKPFEFSDLWADSDITARLAELPHTRVTKDRDGRRSAAFGLAASGQALLYGPDGRLLFNGGLTASRGHQGRSAGQARLNALLAGRDLGREAPVFGCGLKEKECPHGADGTVSTL